MTDINTIATNTNAASALTTNRAYREALPREAALEIMVGEMDGSFDPQYLEVLKDLH